MTYDTFTGQLAVWRGGTHLGSWTDPTPLTSGAYLALRTDSADVSFDSLTPLIFYEALAPEDHRATMQAQPGADVVDRHPVGGPQNDPGPIGQPPLGFAVVLELP